MKNQKICIQCGKEYKKDKRISFKEWAKRRYCSGKCYGLSKTGIPRPQKVIEKISITNSGENNPFYGKNHTKKTREKMQEKRKLRIREKAPNWQDGKSFEPYGTEFNKQLKNKIRKRDNFICQECGKTQNQLFRRVKGKKIKGYKLYIHHIDYDKQNNSQFNLISLCLECHMKTNFNRKHWKEHFQMKMFIKEFFNPENFLVFNKNKQLIGVTKI